MYKGLVMRFENGFKVGDGGLIGPSTYSVDTGDIDLNDKRSTSGYLTRNRIRGGKDTVYTLTVSWERLTWEQLSKLIAAGEAAKFELEFLDPKSPAGFTKKTMYRDANMHYELKNIASSDEAYWSTSMSFVEF